MKINLVDDMASSVNCFGPEPDRSLVFSKHNSGHLNKSTILSVNNTILLWCVCSREFMSKTIIIKKFFDMSILEFCTIITLNMLQSEFILDLSSLCKCLEYFNNFALVM